jgi:uncharacterized membrane protein
MFGIKKKRSKSKTYMVASVAGAAATAAVTYWLDPVGGRRRRARLRDKAVHATHEAEEAVETTTHDLVNRARGTVAETASKFRREEVSDSILEERVRAAIGRVSSHPGSIEVASSRGVVTLRGPILKDEMMRVVSRVSQVSGVKDIENELEAHDTPGNIPGLQGNGHREERFEYLQENWAPAPRLLAGMTGLGLAAFSVVKRTPLSIGAGVAGLSLFLRSATNKPFKRLVGIGGGRRAVDLQVEIFIDAPVEEVYSFWLNPENFPRFMTHVKEVRDLGDGRFHWKVEGPGGVPFEWDAEITQRNHNEVVAWRSLPGALVGNSGIVRFEPDDEGTSVRVQMHYNPPGGRLGHMFATLLGADPRQQMDDDLMRLKSLLETGATRGDEGTVTKEELVEHDGAPQEPDTPRRTPRRTRPRNNR